jgi:hypothetical protein
MLHMSEGGKLNITYDRRRGTYCYICLREENLMLHMSEGGEANVRYV